MQGIWILFSYPHFFDKEKGGIVLLLMGFDSSTRSTGYSVFNGDKLVKYGCIDLTEEKDTEVRIARMIKNIMYLLNKYNPDEVSAEQMVVGRNLDTSRKLIFVLSSIVVWCYQNDKKLTLYIPTQWRKITTVTQYAKEREDCKRVAKIIVDTLFNIDTNDDVAEAILIGLARVIENGECHINFWKLKDKKGLEK